MRKQILAILIICALAMGFTSMAEKKNILVKSYSNVVVNDTNNYQVNGQGDLVTYSFTKDNTGVITAIYYTLTKKSGIDVIGQIGPGPKIADDFIPDDSIAFEIVGLERNVALVLFTNIYDSKIYMVFRLVNKYANPTPNRTNPVQHVALANETCSITNSQILSLISTQQTVKTVSNRARVANIAVITTSSDHSLSVGDRVTILSVPDDSYNAADVQVLSVPTTTTFSYSNPGDDEAEVVSTGLVYRPEMLQSVTEYNHSWNPLPSKGIDNDYGSLSAINTPLQKYYKGVEPTAETTKFNISILKP